MVSEKRRHERTFHLSFIATAPGRETNRAHDLNPEKCTVR